MFPCCPFATKEQQTALCAAFAGLPTSLRSSVWTPFLQQQQVEDPHLSDPILTLTLFPPLPLLPLSFFSPFLTTAERTMQRTIDYIGTPSNPGYYPPLLKYRPSIQSSKSLLPCQVTYSQVPGIRMWTSLRGLLFWLLHCISTSGNSLHSILGVDLGLVQTAHSS